MKFNKILFVLLFCAGVQSGGIVRAEEPSRLEAPKSQSWGEWAGSYMTSGKERAQALAAAARKKTQAIAEEAKKRARELVDFNDIVFMPQKKLPLPVVVGGALVGMQVLNNVIESFLANESLVVGTWYVVAGLCGYGAIKDAIAWYQKGKISKEEAVALTKKAIYNQLSDEKLYPTFSSKIHALLKKDEFGFDLEDPDGILQEACAEITKNLHDKRTKLKKNWPQRHNDWFVVSEKPIDEAISSLRNQMRKKNITGLDQIHHVEEQLKSSQLTEAVKKGYMSLLLRLKRQKAIKEKLQEIMEEEIRLHSPF